MEIKGVAMQRDARQRVAFGRQPDFDDIEATGNFVPLAKAQISVSQLANLALFGNVDGFLRRAHLVGSAGFDFDKTQNAAFPRNTVEFAAQAFAGSPIAHDDFIAARFQITRRDSFAGVTALLAQLHFYGVVGGVVVVLVVTFVVVVVPGRGAVWTGMLELGFLVCLAGGLVIGTRC